MIIKIILTAIFIVFLIYGLDHRNNSRAIGIVINITSIVGVFLVWFPEYATQLGQIVGVGRGADLVFYLFIMASLISGFGLYIKILQVNLIITQLARKIALMNPKAPIPGDSE